MSLFELALTNVTYGLGAAGIPLIIYALIARRKKWIFRRASVRYVGGSLILLIGSLYGHHLNKTELSVAVVLFAAISVAGFAACLYGASRLLSYLANPANWLRTQSASPRIEKTLGVRSRPPEAGRQEPSPSNAYAARNRDQRIALAIFCVCAVLAVGAYFVSQSQPKTRQTNAATEPTLGELQSDFSAFRAAEREKKLARASECVGKFVTADSKWLCKQSSWVGDDMEEPRCDLGLVVLDRATKEAVAVVNGIEVPAQFESAGLQQRWKFGDESLVELRSGGHAFYIETSPPPDDMAIRKSYEKVMGKPVTGKRWVSQEYRCLAISS